MKIFYILLVSGIICPLQMLAQNYTVQIQHPTDGNNYTLNNNDVTSDFGRREGNLSKFHRGGGFESDGNVV